MKQLALLIGVVIAAAAIAGLADLASAGDYHVGRLLVCSDCHIAHGSQRHPYYSDADTTIVNRSGTPPYGYLLRGETQTNACLTCHDGRVGTADVLMGNTNSSTHGRSAGALNVPTGGAHGYMPEDPYGEGDGHTLWSQKTPPGGTGTGGLPGTAPLISEEGLECTDCHRAHGNKYFRNMMGATATTTATFFNSLWRGTEVTYEISPTPTQPAAVWVLEKAPRNYDNDNVQYLEKADQASSEYGKWCQTCHTVFHGSQTTPHMLAANGHVGRHPTMGVEMSSTNATTGVTTPFTAWAITDPTHRLKVMSATGAWAAAASAMPNDLTPSCFTCHKSHGNANPFGLIFVMSNRPAPGSSAPAGSHASLIDPVPSDVMTEEGDGGQYRDLCRNCHGMGSWPSGNPTAIIP